MASKKRAVFGIFDTRAKAEQTIYDLLAANFSNDDISVLLPDVYSSKDFAHEKKTKAPEGTAAGVTAGGALGGTLGLLAGIGALALPGIGPLIAAGPIMAMLAGMGAGGAVGAVIGALVGMGIPEFEAKRYEGHVRGGGILMSVHCDTSDEVQKAKKTMEHNGARDISETVEASVPSTPLEEDEKHFIDKLQGPNFS